MERTFPSTNSLGHIIGEDMKTPTSRVLISIVIVLAVSGLHAQNAAQPAYLNPTLSPQQRAADLVHRMTVQEKVSQLVNQSRAVPRLNVPDYDWWSESLHGVAVNGTTEFPEPVGLAATFDTPTIHTMGVAIGTEGRIKHAQAVRARIVRVAGRVDETLDAATLVVERAAALA